MSASSEPVTSALRMRLSVAASPAWICSKMSSSLAPPVMAWASRPIEATRCQCSRVSATLRAVFSSGATTKRSPASATSDRPSTWTGVDGPASLTWSPWSSMSARTRPQAAPATSGSPTLRVPRWTRIVATGPRPMSRLDSSTTPRARPSGLARRSSSSATTSSVLEQVVDAEVLQRGDLDHDGVAAPRLGDEAVLGELLHDPVGVGVLAVDLVDRRRRSGPRPPWRGRAPRCVWGMTPSSAATTRMTMSVASAPRARMAVNASWPGVSMKVMRLAVLDDLVGADVLGDATGLAGDHVGVADLVEQLRLAVVDVAHDGDDRRRGPARSRSRRPRRRRRCRAACWSSTSCSSPGSTRRISAPISAANSSIMSSLSDCVAVTISPCCMRKRTTSAAVRFSLGPSSWGVDARSMTIVALGDRGVARACSWRQVHRLQLFAVATTTTLAALRATRAARATGTTATGTAGTTTGATAGTTGTTTGATATGTAAATGTRAHAGTATAGTAGTTAGATGTRTGTAGTTTGAGATAGARRMPGGGGIGLPVDERRGTAGRRRDRACPTCDTGGRPAGRRPGHGRPDRRAGARPGAARREPRPGAGAAGAGGRGAARGRGDRGRGGGSGPGCRSEAMTRFGGAGGAARRRRGGLGGGRRRRGLGRRGRSLGGRGGRGRRRGRGRLRSGGRRGSAGAGAGRGRRRLGHGRGRLGRRGPRRGPPPRPSWPAWPSCRLLRLLGLHVADEALPLGLAADAVGLRVDDARGVALHADPERDRRGRASPCWSARALGRARGRECFRANVLPQSFSRSRTALPPGVTSLCPSIAATP